MKEVLVTTEYNILIVNPLLKQHAIYKRYRDEGPHNLNCRGEWFASRLATLPQ
jgi:hypothetical protein